MKKKGLLFVLIFVVLCGLSSCAKKPEASRVTIDVNPSFELIVDKDKKVVSVTALNDDASVLIYGEALVGKDIEDATEILINLTVNAGYVDDQQTISISVSGDGSFQRKLEKAIAKKIDKVLDKTGIEATIQKNKAIAVDQLRKIVLENSTFTKEEVDAMNEEQLLKALQVSRIETCQLLSEQMRKQYFKAKAYEIEFAEKELTAQIIDELGGMYSAFHKGYVLVLDLYSEAIKAVEKAQYELLLDSDSVYQQILNKALEAKTKYLEQKKYVASLEVGDLKVQAELDLTKFKADYDQLIQQLENIAKQINQQFDTLIEAMKKAEEQFATIEESFDDNIKQTLQANATQIEEKLNNLKDSFFDEFEKKYKDDINAYLENLKKQKEALQAEIKAN